MDPDQWVIVSVYPGFVSGPLDQGLLVHGTWDGRAFLDEAAARQRCAELNRGSRGRVYAAVRIEQD